VSYRFVIDLDDHEGSGIVTKYRYSKNGEIEEEMSSVQDGEGAHMLYNVTDTVMNKVPSDKTFDEASDMSHAHQYGYETFFVDSGRMYVYIDGVRVLVETGDILQLQPGQQHAMASLEDVKFRGFFHDLDAFANGIKNLELVKMYPEAANDPDFRARAMGKDHIKRERPYYIDVPTEKVNAIKNPKRPIASYEFEGATVKVIVPRWEDGGVCECICAEMEPGFTVNWVKYPEYRELFYVRNGKVKFTICGKEYIAGKACIVNVPRLAPHSLVALEKSEVYEVHAQTHWFSFLQDYQSIRKLFPERLADPNTLISLKEKFGVQIDSIGMTQM
jgi:quercetin dioxygenase-like cupin family protein